MKAGSLALKALIFLGLSTSVFANSEVKVFRCYKPINPYDLTFEQGQEQFLDLYLSSKKAFRFEHYDMSGDLDYLPLNHSAPFVIGNDFTSLVATSSEARLSMVFLGGDNWGAHLTVQSREFEFMCRELVTLEEL